MGGKKFGVELGSVTSLQPWSHTTAPRGGNVMVWGRITIIARTELYVCLENVTGLYYRDNVIGPYARSAWECSHFLKTTLARAYRARVVQDHPQFRRITTLPWPAKSPDLPPIEYLCDILWRRVRRRPLKPQDINELADALQEKWRRIPQATTGRLIRSMRRHRLAVIGGPIRCWDLCDIDTLTLTKLVANSKSTSSRVTDSKPCWWWDMRCPGIILIQLYEMLF